MGFISDDENFKDKIYISAIGNDRHPYEWYNEKIKNNKFPKSNYIWKPCSILRINNNDLCSAYLKLIDNYKLLGNHLYNMLIKDYKQNMSQFFNDADDITKELIEKIKEKKKKQEQKIIFDEFCKQRVRQDESAYFTLKHIERSYNKWRTSSSEYKIIKDFKSLINEKYCEPIDGKYNGYRVFTDKEDVEIYDEED